MKRSIVSYVMAGGIILFLLVIFQTNLGHYNYAMNSDIGAEAMLAEVIASSGQNIPDSWYPSTETRFVTTPNLAALFYRLCNSVNLAMGLACCVMTLLIVISSYSFGKSIDLSMTGRLGLILMILMMPDNFDTLEILYLFACYYSVHVVALFWTLSLYCNLIRKRKLNRISLCLCTFLAILLGVQGMRGMLVLYGPLFGIEIIRTLYLLYSGKKREKCDHIAAIWVILLVVFNFIGSRFPVSVGQDFSRNIRNGFSKLCTIVIPDIARAIGFENTGSIGKVCLCIFLVAAVYVLATVLWKMVRRKEIEETEWAYLFLCASPVLTALIVSFTTVDSSVRYYFVLLFAMSLAVILLVEKYARKHISLKIIVGAAVACFMLINFRGIYLPVLRSEDPPKTDAYQVVQYLEENDYTLAYTTFEHANMMTALSDGRVKVASVASVENMDICKWLSCKDWYVPNMPYKMKTAYIITEAEMGNFSQFYAKHENDLAFMTQIGNYHIYVSEYNFSNLGE